MTGISVSKSLQGDDCRIVAHITAIKNGETLNYRLELGNLDNFVKSTEEFQKEMGKEPSQFLPIEIYYDNNRAELINKILKTVSMLVLGGLMFRAFQSVRAGLGQNRGSNVGGDIFGFGNSQPVFAL